MSKRDNEYRVKLIVEKQPSPGLMRQVFENVRNSEQKRYVILNGGA